MTTLNAQQLAFILDIKKDTARDKMLYAFSVENNIVLKFYYKKGSDKPLEDYPDEMSIEMLSRRLNLPTLQSMVNDICTNYLKRPATKKWILCDYPEKKILSNKDADKPSPVRIPTALRSMLPSIQQDEIMSEWRKRFGEKAIR